MEKTPISRKLFIIAIALILLASFMSMLQCSDPQARISELNKEVLELHDSSMVKMDAIYDQVDQLRSQKEKLELDTLGEHQQAIVEILDAIVALEAADEGMMAWMRTYEPPAKEAPPKEAEMALNEYKTSILQVDQDIDKSLENAEQILAKYQ